MPFGLKEKNIFDILNILSVNKNISHVILFGSRAKGNFKQGSDIDIAIKGDKLTLNDIIKFSCKFDELSLPWKVDIVLYNRVESPELLEHIERAGVILFENNKFRKFGLQPLVDNNSRILILGSFPSEISLKKQEYYANPQNKFWEIICNALKEPFSLDYQERLFILKKHHIALWDVLGSCMRSGSSDNKIRNEKANNLKIFAKQYPDITHLLFNGIKPVEYFVKHKMNEGRLTPVPSLPSTSPANTHLTFEEKIERWSGI
ncbi:MAG: DNA-deoxyinosine glycosylase, partial [Bacteroidetes bacterium]|nr:DNA-deoxyinosine glycosylase [Bacteroidota bacterium]